jgi:hypothetical protein
LKILRTPNGNCKLMEAGLECGARAFGLSFEDALALVSPIFLKSRFRSRNFPYPLLVLKGDSSGNKPKS